MAERSAKRGRGRIPDPERTARTRSAILQAALAVFSERGFAETRMADVASRAGLAKGTLYLHFADKESLFEFVLRESLSDRLAGVQLEPAAPAESPRAALERLLLPVLRGAEESGRAAVVRLILSEGVRHPALAAMHRRLVVEPAMSMVRAQARRAAAAGDERAAALLRFPQLVAAPIVLATIWNGLWPDEKLDLAEVFEAFLDLAFP